MLVKHLSTPQIMRQVVYALIPAIIAYYYYFGAQILINLIIAILSAYAADTIALLARRYSFAQIARYVGDGSSVVTAVLLTLSVPLTIPWYLLVAGVLFGLLVAKHIYGGLGNNIFNPAMLGFVFLLISFPEAMSNHTHFAFDGISGATMLDANKHQLPVYNTANIMILINLLYVVGGIYLWARKIIFWQIPVSMLLAVALFGFIFDAMSMHLLFGGVMLGAFFIATDGVGSPLTSTGRLLYGFIIGVLVVCIREFGVYPDGVAFSVLISNLLTPLIDYYFKK